MLKLQPNPTFEGEVTIRKPGGETEVIELTFRHMGRAESGKFLKRAVKMDDADSALEIVAGWRKVDGEFNRENMAQLLEAYPSAGGDILKAWLSLLGGEKLKN